MKTNAITAPIRHLSSARRRERAGNLQVLLLMGSGVAAAYRGSGLLRALAAMSPGPSFLVTARTAVAQSRADGIKAALGLGGRSEH